MYQRLNIFKSSQKILKTVSQDFNPHGNKLSPNDLDYVSTQNAPKLSFLVQVSNFREKNIFV